MNFKAIYFEKKNALVYFYSHHPFLYMTFILHLVPEQKLHFIIYSVKIENIHLLFAVVPEKLLHLLCRTFKGVFVAAGPTYNFRS